MTAYHGGTKLPKGSLNKGARPQPATTAGQFHGGTLLPTGKTRSPQGPVYGTHGGTNLPRVLNKKQK